MIIGAVGEEFLDEGKDGSRRLQHRSGGIAVLHIGRVGFEQQAAPIGIDKGMAFAALDLLAGIIAPWSAALGRLHALTVDDRRRRTGFAPDSAPGRR